VGACRCAVHRSKEPQAAAAQAPSLDCKGPAKKKSVTPVVGGWGSRGSEAKKGPGSDLFFDIFKMVLLNSPRRETPKNVIKNNRQKISFGFFVDFFVKAF
jgi:hypothetical protein